MLESGTELGEGRYRITGEIARGGMATVYRALDAELKEVCAIKVLRPREEADKDQLHRRFHREAAMMTRLRHENIVRVYDTGASKVGPYLVMELAESGSAWDWVQRHGPMPPRLAVQVVIQVLAGLGHAHTHGVVHRDVKPQNILFDWMGTPKLSDFGVARIADTAGSATTTTSGTILGTYHYLAPEIREDARKATEVSDIYATAGCLYALLVGRHPRELHGADAFPDVLQGVPPVLQPVIKQATRYEPDERYPSAEALVAALREAESELPELEESASLGIGGETGGPPESRLYRASDSHRPSPPEPEVPLVAVLVAAAIVALALVMGAIASG
ncbi:MAG: serine/threonine protein kinase [Deltaproteobacteria bacterium]|nr:MAG: serine/threonine protein kinase [Deltaproteobacteria bacterium]